MANNAESNTPESDVETMIAQWVCLCFFDLLLCFNNLYYDYI